MGIGVSTAWDAVRAGDVPSIRLGKRVVISQLVVDRLLADPGAVQAQAQ
ncbi:MAG TPA: hypothetical protein VD902_04925 [Symbiobacteriaceae bacterium]|nr:hypothetical protein [Symbiobacteriaceae bacterium]